MLIIPVLTLIYGAAQSFTMIRDKTLSRGQIMQLGEMIK